MRKQKLKSLIHDLEILVDSLKTEIYSDTNIHQVSKLVHITKMTMTTTDMRTNTRAKKLVKVLEKIISQEHLYTDEQLREMKQALRVVKKEMDILNTKLKRGFGS